MNPLDPVVPGATPDPVVDGEKLPPPASGSTGAYTAWSVIAGTNASAMIQALVVIAQYAEPSLPHSLSSVFGLAVIIVVTGCIGLSLQAVQLILHKKCIEEKDCSCGEKKCIFDDSQWHVLLGVCVTIIQLLSIVMNTVANNGDIYKQRLLATTTAPTAVPPTSIPPSPAPSR